MKREELELLMKAGMISVENDNLDTVVDYLKENGFEEKELEVHLSEEDLQDLMAGEDFHWTFDGVDIHLFQGECEDE